jgi:peptide/nickel transport system ATP-binding protein
MPGDVIMKVTNLKKYFELRRGFFSVGEEAPKVKAVDDVNFEMREGEILGLVGESGCGKTTTGRLLTRLEDPTDGFVFFQGRDIARLEGEDLKVFRRNIQMVFQDPYESLNPRTTVLQTVMEPLINHNIGDSFEARADAVVKALEDAGLAPAKEYLNRFPHELSGGQRQRVSIARALVINPKVIVADEPVSMLDVSIRAGVLNLMLDLRDKYNIPYLFITHDIAVARYVSDRLGVMYLGRVVELAETEEAISRPLHPYTQALLSAVPVPDPKHKHGRITIKGEIPSAIAVPLGCRFRPRCPKAFIECGWEAADMAEFMLREEKIKDPKHPMANDIETLEPSGFTLSVKMKSGGSKEKVKGFIESKVATLKASSPLFQAVSAVDVCLGGRIVEVQCKSVSISGERVAQELSECLTQAVDISDKNHPMHGRILAISREGATVALTVGKDIEAIAGFARDFVKRYRSAGFPEFKSIEQPEVKEAKAQVVLRCKSGKMPGNRVGRDIMDMIDTDFERNSTSPHYNSILPMKLKKKLVRFRVLGPADRWEKLAEDLKKYFQKRAGEGVVAAKGAAKVTVKTVKQTQDTVEVKFIKIQEPPLADVGNGHMVACYLFKPVAR